MALLHHYACDRLGPSAKASIEIQYIVLCLYDIITGRTTSYDINAAPLSRVGKMQKCAEDSENVRKHVAL